MLQPFELCSGSALLGAICNQAWHGLHICSEELPPRLLFFPGVVSEGRYRTTDVCTMLSGSHGLRLSFLCGAYFEKPCVDVTITVPYLFGFAVVVCLVCVLYVWSFLFVVCGFLVWAGDHYGLDSWSQRSVSLWICMTALVRNSVCAFCFLSSFVQLVLLPYGFVNCKPF